MDKRILAIVIAGGAAAGLLLLGALAPKAESVTARAESPAPAPDTAGLFRIDGDKVIISAAEEGVTTTPELLRISAADFEKPAHVYRERVYVSLQGIISKPFLIPSDAQQMAIVARGDSVEGMFPRMEVSILEEGGGNSNPIILYTGNVQSHTLKPVTVPTAGITGKQVRLKLRLLNPYDVHDGINLIVAYVSFTR